MQLQISIYVSSLYKSKKISKEISQHMIYLLYGEMGAGKSTFVKNYLSNLGIQYSGSPTFNLVNEYHTKDGSKIIHIDFYRIKSTDMMHIVNEYIFNLDSPTVFIEWPSEELIKYLPIEKTIPLCFVNRCNSYSS